jgi:competence protein ComEA
VDSPGDWRVIDADEDRADARGQPAHERGDDHVPRWLIGAVAAIVAVAAALAIWATLPAGGVAVQSSSGPFDPRVVADATLSSGGSLTAGPGTVVVDVEGAVTLPGVHELTVGSRVGDAITAAGGYAATADIDAASRMLNLAARLTDGQQIHVPALGEQTVATPNSEGNAAGSQAPGSGALIDINHASADELDTLPGIGPVTAAKIIDARTATPFGSVDELQSRGVVGQSTFDKLRDLVTVTP